MQENTRLFAGAAVTVVLAALLCAPALAHAGTAECIARIDKTAAAFAKKRARQVVRCARNPECRSAALEAALHRLSARTVRRLLLDCAGVDPADIGMGSTCPDPTGQCTQTLDSPQALADCVVCMIAETVDPLVRRLRGQPSDDAETCGGCAGTECSPELFCERKPGNCDDPTAVGVCIEPPDACPDVYRPVCGCDGVTYANNCERQQARVGLRHPGPCVIRCGGASGQSCPEGSVCEGLPGRCDGNVEDGICVPVPDACPDHYRPVCGCDGVTYRNNCERIKAGVRLLHFGECKHECTLDSSGQADCGPGRFCEQPPGVCSSEPGTKGVCVEMPEVCTQHWDPVCGCDGQTYSNDCFRMAAGVSKAHDGECERTCGTIGGPQCGPGEMCELPPHTCDAADLPGHCVAQPDACPDLYEPVCGCDGVTYPNDCERRRAGAQLDHAGPCETKCTSNADCAAGEACIPLPGHCEPGGPAACVHVPDYCPMLGLMPVCGCDGVTYDTPCDAIRAGVGIDHKGACETPCNSDADCSAGQVCWKLPGQCDGPGRCAPIRSDCPLMMPAFPVCGCDGVTYPSLCDALLAGVSIEHEGPCQ